MVNKPLKYKNAGWILYLKRRNKLNDDSIVEYKLLYIQIAGWKQNWYRLIYKILSRSSRGGRGGSSHAPTASRAGEEDTRTAPRAVEDKMVDTAETDGRIQVYRESPEDTVGEVSFILFSILIDEPSNEVFLFQVNDEESLKRSRDQQDQVVNRPYFPFLIHHTTPLHNY
ncbi:hypothetical protein AVEN_3350-1 [Araneus ventricosus]|uniref:Uncharacterized protein n=1 Tax=Araneus ventricosus TaxID=182803 RepID=A0A4Y2FSD9_ARAVE|nr:hypothetical protein AVEN_3350-1 [Araneus ventricosus]